MKQTPTMMSDKAMRFLANHTLFTAGTHANAGLLAELDAIPIGIHQRGQLDGHPVYGDIQYLAVLTYTPSGGREHYDLHIEYCAPMTLTQKELIGYGLAIYQTAFPKLVANVEERI